MQTETRPIPSTPRQRKVAYLLLAPAMLLWVLMESMFRFPEYSTFQVVWTRYAIYLAILTAWAAPKYGVSFVKSRRVGLHFLRSMTMLAMPAAFIFGRDEIGATSLMAVFWIAPLLTAAIGSWWLGERLPWGVWLLMIVALAAVEFMAPPGESIVSPWALLGLVMACSFALYLPMTRALSASDPLVTKLFHSAFGVFVVLTLTAPLYFKPWSSEAFAGMALIGVMILITLTLMEKALSLSESAWLAPALFLQPLFLFGILGIKGVGLNTPGTWVACGVLVLSIVGAIGIGLGLGPGAARSFRDKD